MKNTTHFPVCGKDGDTWKFMALIAALLLVLPLSGWAGNGGMAGGTAQNGSSSSAQRQKEAHSGHGYFGVYILSSPNGVMTVYVEAESPGEKAGIQPGDTITGFNKSAIKGVKDVFARVAQAPTGKTVIITVLRNKEKMDIPVKMSEKPEELDHCESGIHMSQRKL